MLLILLLAVRSFPLHILSEKRCCIKGTVPRESDGKRGVVFREYVHARCHGWAISGHQRCALTSDTDLCIRYRTKGVSVRQVVRSRIVSFFCINTYSQKTLNLKQAREMQQIMTPVT